MLACSILFPSESPQAFVIAAKYNLLSLTTSSVAEGSYHNGSIGLQHLWEKCCLSQY